MKKIQMSKFIKTELKSDSDLDSDAELMAKSDSANDSE